MLSFFYSIEYIECIFVIRSSIYLIVGVLILMAERRNSGRFRVSAERDRVESSATGRATERRRFRPREAAALTEQRCEDAAVGGQFPLQTFNDLLASFPPAISHRQPPRQSAHRRSPASPRNTGIRCCKCQIPIITYQILNAAQRHDKLIFDYFRAGGRSLVCAFLLRKDIDGKRKSDRYAK